MNKSELLAEIKAAGSYSSQADAEQALKAVAETIVNVVASGKEVNIPKFGKFVPALQKGKTGTIPGTDKTYTTQDRMVPKFKASSVFKDAVATGN